MPGPARAGALIYAKDMNGLAVFYEAVLGMRTLHATAELMVIESADFQMVRTPCRRPMPSGVQISTAAAREDTAIKLFFTVDSLAEARSVPSPGRRLRDRPARFRCAACDRRTSFQLREFFA
jgi:predicted enzyme related to lactoylglutathione lyase